MAALAGFKPAVCDLEDRCIVQLCYRAISVITPFVTTRGSAEWTFFFIIHVSSFYGQGCGTRTHSPTGSQPIMLASYTNP